MTGFAEARAQYEGWQVWLSVRCVNHRFLDLHVHLPEGWDRVEPLVRRVVRERIRRGRVDVRIHAVVAPQAVPVNREIAAKYLSIVESLRAEFNIGAEPDLVHLLGLPGVVGQRSLLPGGGNDFDGPIEQCLGEALGGLDRMRLAEGQALKEDLAFHLQRIGKLTENAETLAKQASQLFARRLENRLKELLSGSVLDPVRLAQEAALAASRADTSEELVRLRSHAAQFAAILDEPGEAGKKLDFLVQEMNREANTLLSKVSGSESENLEITRVGLEVKSEIEKLKEQVQNLE